MPQYEDKVQKEPLQLNTYFLNYVSRMLHILVKLKFLKLTLLGAFGAGVLATLIAKEMRKMKVR